MATTSPDNLWSPDPGNNYNLTVDLAAMQASVQTALTSTNGALAALTSTVNQRTDTMFGTNVPVASGVSGGIRIRRQGGFVEISLDISGISGGVAPGTSKVLNASPLTAPYLPAIHARAGVAYSGGTNYMFFYVSTTGEIQLTNPPGNTVSGVARGQVVYFIGNNY